MSCDTVPTDVANKFNYSAIDHQANKSHTKFEGYTIHMTMSTVESHRETPHATETDEVAESV